MNEFDIESEIPEDYLFSAKATVELAEIFATEIQNDRDAFAALGEKYDDFSCRVEERMLEVENREIVHECIKGNKTSKETVVLSDVSPVTHNMGISLFSEGYSDYSNVNVTVHGKNLFGLEGRSVQSFGAASNTTRRSFTGDGIYLGVAGTNFVNPDNADYVYDSDSNEYKVNCRVSWFGVGIDIPVKPRDIYTFGLKTDNSEARIVCGFYSSNGEYLSVVQGTNMKITVPDNAYWMLCILASSRVADGVSFKEVQLEKGSNATEFCKYVPPQIMKSEGNGNVVGVKSVYPVTIIEADNGEVDISVNYNRDVNIAFNELRNAIIALGGSL